MNNAGEVKNAMVTLTAIRVMAQIGAFLTDTKCPHSSDELHADIDSRLGQIQDELYEKMRALVPEIETDPDGLLPMDIARLQHALQHIEKQAVRIGGQLETMCIAVIASQQ